MEANDTKSPCLILRETSGRMRNAKPKFHRALYGFFLYSVIAGGGRRAAGRFRRRRESRLLGKDFCKHCRFNPVLKLVV
jgi:hypothetical protein